MEIYSVLIEFSFVCVWKFLDSM